MVTWLIRNRRPPRTTVGPYEQAFFRALKGVGFF